MRQNTPYVIWLFTALLTTLLLNTSSVYGAIPACARVLLDNPMGEQAKTDTRMPPAILKVAAIQYPLAEKSTEAALLRKINAYLAQAKAGGAELVVFPELIATEMIDWGAELTSQFKYIAKHFTPRYQEWLRSRSREMGLAILGGTSPRIENGKIYNTALLALPNGQIVLQDKIFLTPDEKEWGWTPGKTLRVFETPWGKTVITVCFDCEFPLISQLLASKHPDLFLVPSWTGSLSGLNRVDWTARARAIEHYAFVVKVGTVPDTHSTQSHFGRSAILSPQETGFPTEPTEGLLNQPGIVFAELKLALQRQMKPKSGVYPSHEQDVRSLPVRIESVTEH